MPKPKTPQRGGEAMVQYLIASANLQEYAESLAATLQSEYGVFDPEDLKHLASTDIHHLIVKFNMKKAPACRLTDAWKTKSGIMDEPEGNPNDGDATYIDHSRRLLTQVYYRQNMYVASAQFLDQRDLSKYLAPIVIITSLSSFLGFLSSSSIFNELHLSRAVVGLSSGILGVVATTLTALRNAQKFDVKAETFRSAGGQYRILATKLEERIRAHRHLLNEIDGDPGTNAQEKKDAIAIAKEAFLTFFADSYERIMTAQSEMKYFPPQWKLKEWVTLGTLRPNPIDQPMAKFRDPGYKLNKHERERALYLLTNADVPYKEFQAFDEVKQALGVA